MAGCARQGGPGPAEAARAASNLETGHQLMAAGEYEAALKWYLRAGAETGLTAEVLAAIGSANLHLGRLGQAEKALRRAVKKNPASVTAWNNLGVVLIERGETAEAERVFRTAFALDSGQTQEIRDNLALALAKLENSDYSDAEEPEFALVRRGSDRYLLLKTSG